MNIVHYIWPGLLSIPEFLTEFVTLIVKVCGQPPPTASVMLALRTTDAMSLISLLLPFRKATPTSGAALPVPFYTLTDYERWKTANDSGRGWKIKYYKGLGTSSLQDAKSYFTDLRNHRITFRWDAVADRHVV